MSNTFDMAVFPQQALDEILPASTNIATPHDDPTAARLHPDSVPTVAAALKRTASSAFQDSLQDGSSRKKLKEDTDGSAMAITVANDQVVDGEKLADELEQELQCGCCSALVYRPVLVQPCQHFFCGSCVVQWVRNGGTNCPACRGIALSVAPSRAIQSMADILSRAAPSRARSVNERIQADEIYRPNFSLRIPTPRQPSPEPNLQANNNYVHPCPHCSSGNQWGWRCSQPIVDPDADPDNAWNSEEGTPPGHAYCGNCENILALQAPTTTKCDFCQVSFCGIGIPGRCIAAPLASQHPQGLSDLADLIQCGEIYDTFDQNPVEVDIMFDYLTAQNFTPRHIYRDIIASIVRSPRQFQPLFELELFMDVHPVSGGTDPDPSAPRQRICRVCATEVLLWGLKDWWVQERKKGFLEEEIMKRPDCPDGSICARQKDHSHAKEFNHIISPPEPSAPSDSAAHDPLVEPQPVQPPENVVDAVQAVIPQPHQPHPPVPFAAQPQAGPSNEIFGMPEPLPVALAFPIAAPSNSLPIPSSQDQVDDML